MPVARAQIQGFSGCRNPNRAEVTTISPAVIPVSSHPGKESIQAINIPEITDSKSQVVNL
jgi:hypothetical protein